MKKYKYRLVTPEIREKMIKMRKRGKKLSEIGSVFGVSGSTVAYHTDKRIREIAIKRAKKYGRKHRSKKYDPEYQRKYRYDRYYNDDEFRRRVIEFAKRYQKYKRGVKNESKSAK